MIQLEWVLSGKLDCKLSVVLFIDNKFQCGLSKWKDSPLFANVFVEGTSPYLFHPSIDKTVIQIELSNFDRANSLGKGKTLNWKPGAGVPKAV